MAKHWKLILLLGVILFFSAGSNNELFFRFGYLVFIPPLLLIIFSIVECVAWSKQCAEARERAAAEQEAQRQKAEEERKRLEEEEKRKQAERQAAADKRREEIELQRAEVLARRAGTVEQEFSVAGVSRHQAVFRKYGSVNPDYNMSARELEEYVGPSDIPQYDFSDVSLTLETEPDNPVDPNAVKIMMEGELIGYIPKEDAAHVGWLLDNDRIVDADFRVVGGPLKRYDPLTESVEKVPLSFGVRISLYVRPEDAADR